ncbi:MAG: phage major capsid protein [Desulfamplus sp.]
MLKNERVIEHLKQSNFEYIKAQLKDNFKYLAENYEPEQSRKEYKSAFSSYLRSGSTGTDLTRYPAYELMQMVKKYQGRISVDSTGRELANSYLVPVELSKEIEKRTLDYVSMRKLAKIETAYTGEYKKPLSVGGIAGAWCGEHEDVVTTNNPNFALFAPKLHEVYCNPLVTNQLLGDAAFDVEAWLISEISDCLALLEGEAFINGTGVNCPNGLLNPDRIIDNDNADYRKIGYLKSGHTNLLNNADCLIDVWTALPAQYRVNGTWLMNDNTLNVIKKLKTTEDYIFKDGLSVNSDRLIGRPIEIDINMPDIGAGTYPVAFGDFRAGYCIVDHITGLRCLRDMYSAHGFTTLYAFKRVGGGVYNGNAIKLLKIAE